MSQHKGPQLLSAKSLQSDTVDNLQGEKLGSIKDLLLDASSGRIAYAVIDCGGFLGVGGKLFAVPWEALQYDQQADCFHLDVHKQRLEKAQGFDPAQWEDMNQRSWQIEVHDLFGLQPYWERTAHYAG